MDAQIVRMIYEKREDYGFDFNKKKQIYGKPGEVSKKIVKILKKNLKIMKIIFFLGYTSDLIIGMKKMILNILN